MSETKKILIVEDEADEVAYLTALFADNGLRRDFRGQWPSGFRKSQGRAPGPDHPRYFDAGRERSAHVSRSSAGSGDRAISPS